MYVAGMLPVCQPPTPTQLFNWNLSCNIQSNVQVQTNSTSMCGRVGYMTSLLTLDSGLTVCWISMADDPVSNASSQYLSLLHQFISLYVIAYICIVPLLMYLYPKEWTTRDLSITTSPPSVVLAVILIVPSSCDLYILVRIISFKIRICSLCTTVVHLFRKYFYIGILMNVA